MLSLKVEGITSEVYKKRVFFPILWCANTQRSSYIIVHISIPQTSGMVTTSTYSVQ